MTAQHPAPGTRGSVAIVGAGPGDPELITVRGLARLRAAEVVVYDRLVDPRLVAEAPATAERIFVGKAAGFAALDQRAIERLLVARARAGFRVVRLKGGDPFVFGRGGEEVAALVAAGVPVEVVPGLSSALAVPAGAGIPVTHRGVSAAVTIVTGHESPDKDGGEVDWDRLATTPGTLVVLMGLNRLAEIRDRLLAAGRDPDTPAAVIASGTWRDERIVSAPLADLPETVAAAQVVSPALLVVGDVVAWRERFAPSALVGPGVGASPAGGPQRPVETPPVAVTTTAAGDGGSDG